MKLFFGPKLVAIGLVPMALAGCSSADDNADNAAAPMALVKLAPVTQGSAGQQLTVYGAAEAGPLGRMTLVAPAEATVVAIDAPVGTQVGQGQVVARLAASPTTRVDLVKASSDAQAADAALARAERLRADGLASNADVDTARAAARSADALSTGMRQRTGGLTLRAPAAGIVDSVTPAVGDLVQPGAAVASVARLGDARVRFGVDPDTARAVRPGMALIIAGNAARAPRSVPVLSVSPVIDSATKMALIYARVPADSGISPGTTLTATIDLGDSLTALTIPYSALLDDAGQAYVYVVTGGIAHRRDVAVDPSNGDRVTVTKGLKPGERVVVEGGTAVEDGMKVRTQ
jgi:RND family efflux transporter MFP subunit